MEHARRPKPHRLAALLAALAGLTAASCASFELGVRAFFQDSRDDVAAERRGGGAAPERHLVLAPDDWPDFRGPGRSGIAAGELATRWAEDGPPELWRAPCGPAYSSITSAYGLVFTAEQRRDQEAVLALDLETGREVWRRAWPAKFDEVLSKVGPRSTPVIGGERLVFLGATGELLVLDVRDGAVRWRANVLDDAGAANLEYGLAASPVLVRDLLIVPAGEPAEDAGGGMVLAYELATGRLAWSAVPEKMTYSSPIAMELLGETHVVVVSATRVLGLDPESGRVLWSFSWEVRGDVSCTMPRAAGPDSVVVSAGYGAGSVRVRLRASEDGAAIVPETVWRTRRFKTRFNEMVIRDGRAYGLDEGVLACLDLETGERLWRDESHGYGQVTGVPDGLIVTTDDGDVLSLAAGPDGSRELARFSPLDGLTLTPPAVARGRLLVRGRSEIACFDLRPAPPPDPTGAPAAAD